MKQKRRIFFKEKQETIEKEVDMLLEADFIKSIQFSKCIANTVLVKKSNGIWRMCIDYSSINKPCPMDLYPLRNTDQLNKSTTGNEILSFSDAFSGYNQIELAEDDQDNTVFITHKGVFEYKVIPFDLLNAGATFQHPMDIIFGPHIGRNIQLYVDDIIAM